VRSVQQRRESGAVERCHTTPHHGSYSVGLHCYNVAQILLCLHPRPSVTLLEEALCHDHLERWTGDVPAPAKWRNRFLADAILSAEYGEAMRVDHVESETTGPKLEVYDRNWLSCADSLELLMWCDDQLAMGNRHVEKMRAAAWSYLRTRPLPQEMILFIDTYKWERSDD
jgi:5'-deoxynucleotidase YfbR-like HD superfamily hydrolase